MKKVSTSFIAFFLLLSARNSTLLILSTPRVPCVPVAVLTAANFGQPTKILEGPIRHTCRLAQNLISKKFRSKKFEVFSDLTLSAGVKIRAAVIGAPAVNQVSALKRRDGEGFEKEVFAELILNYWKNKDAELKKRSPVFWTEKIPSNITILLLQGSADWRVAAQDNLDLMNKFNAEKKVVKFIFYPGGSHGLREYQKEVDEQTKIWLDKYVRDKSPLPNMELHGR